MIELLQGLYKISGLAFVLLFLNIVIGLVTIIRLKVSKQILNNSFFFIIVIALLIIKSFYIISDFQFSYFSNLLSILAFPAILIALPFYKKLAANRKFISYYINLLLIIYLLDLPFIELFSKRLLPSYSLYFTYIAGITNIVSIYLIKVKALNRKILLVLFIATYLNVLFTLAKWYWPVIFLSPIFLYFAIAQKKLSLSLFKLSNFKFILYFAGFFIVLYIVQPVMAKYLGYASLQDYLEIRVFKSSAFTVNKLEQNQLLGIADGNRMNIYTTIFSEYLSTNKFTGLPLDYTNPYNVSAHNFVVHFVSILGLFGYLYVLKLLVSFTGILKHIKNTQLRYIYIFYIFTVLFTFSVGASYGNIVLLTFIFFNIEIMYATIRI